MNLTFTLGAERDTHVGAEAAAQRVLDATHFGRLAQSLLEARSEEHTSELQSRLHLVCRLLLEKKEHEPGLESRHTLDPRGLSGTREEVARRQHTAELGDGEGIEEVCSLTEKGGAGDRASHYGD